MTRKCLTDEQFGQLTRRLDEVKRRTDEGGIPFAPVMKGLTLIIEGEFPKPLFTRDMRKESGWELVEEGPQVPADFSIAEVERKSFLNHDEIYLKGEELRRRAVTLNANFGQHHAEWLLQHQEEIPRDWRYSHLVFPGTVWRDRDGGLGVPYLSWYGDRWHLLFNGLYYGFNSYARLVCLRA